jgi:integrin beta 1
MDSGGRYTHSSLQDYPSISQINLKVKKHAINVIFAVTASQLNIYEKLKDNVEGASAGQLSEDSSNVVTLIRDEYNVSSVNIYSFCIKI